MIENYQSKYDMVYHNKFTWYNITVFLRRFYMIASFFLSFREGLEAALVIGVLVGALQKTNRKSYQSTIWAGFGFAVILSIIVGILLNRLGASFEGRAEEIFEGITMLLAAGLLTWMILWMQSQARSVNKKLKEDVHQAVLKDSKTALFFVAFLAVIREGIELAFFLTAASMNYDGNQTLIGAALGLASVVVVAVLFFGSIVRLNISKFFQVTSVILLLFAAGLVAHGVHELNESGIIPSVIEHIWDINHIVDDNSTLGLFLKTLVGYNGNPSLTETIAYVLYFGVIWIASNTLINREKKTIAATN
jgi:high-affinity iron transporter